MGHDGGMTTVPGIRQRARAEVTAAILDSARRQLADVGPAALSLRAVARDVGMVSSAVYRYVASREDLLTLLIIESYDGLGAAAELAESAVPRTDLPARWMAVCHAARDWALEHPNEYALIYGTPVPGYAAPQATIAPAARIPALMLAILGDALRAGAVDLSGEPAGEDMAAALAPILAGLPEPIPPVAMARGLLGWTHLYGAISFELFGHRHNVVADDLPARRAFFTYEMTVMAELIGIAPTQR